MGISTDLCIAVSSGETKRHKQKSTEKTGGGQCRGYKQKSKGAGRLEREPKMCVEGRFYACRTTILHDCFLLLGRSLSW